MDREREAITVELNSPVNSVESIALHNDLTPWFSAQLVARLGIEKAQEYVKVMQLPPLVSLRVREPRNRDAVIQRIKSQEIEAFATSYAPGGVFVKGGSPRELIQLLSGDVVIQDEGAQLVALSCDLQNDMTVLDYCAGRGGKSFHLADLAGRSCRITASDIDSNKLNILKNEAEHLGLSNIDVKGKDDLRGYPLFDRVLLDAPCTGSGVIRRHPEICNRLTEEEVERLAQLQRELIEEAVSWVKVGGLFVFSVCSDLPQEGVMQMDWFLDKYPTFQRQAYGDREEINRLELEGRPGELSLSILENGTDGFFITRLKRTA
jgi:16S rRNA (cytosine967-C5)-methyltransferase